MTRLRWNRPRKVFAPWYAAERDLFGPKPGPVKVERLPRRKTARPQVRPAPLPVVAAAGADLSTAVDKIPERSATVEVLRTRDLDKARIALCLATSATVWCDGAAVPNPGRIGWGVVVVADGVRVELFDGGAHGTNNAAELQAAILALQILPASCSATIFGDSQYVILGISKWSAAWKRKNWQKAGQPIPNADLWKQLDALAAGRSISWQWVRGHAGNTNNEIADRLAAAGLRA
jgi:ribonuclease HI